MSTPPTSCADRATTGTCSCLTHHQSPKSCNKCIAIVNMDVNPHNWQPLKGKLQKLSPLGTQVLAKRLDCRIKNVNLPTLHFCINLIPLQNVGPLLQLRASMHTTTSARASEHFKLQCHMIFRFFDEQPAGAPTQKKHSSRQPRFFWWNGGNVFIAHWISKPFWQKGASNDSHEIMRQPVTLSKAYHHIFVIHDRCFLKAFCLLNAGWLGAQATASVKDLTENRWQSLGTVDYLLTNSQ